MVRAEPARGFFCVVSGRGFVSCRWVRASAPVGVSVFSFVMEFCLTMALLCSRGVFKRGDWIETELTNPDVGACWGSGEEV